MNRSAPRRPHLLGVDEGPFVKGQAGGVPVAAALCEGADLLEAVAIGSFPVDGDGATEFLADWLSGLRLVATLQGVALGGITLAGLGVVDVRALSDALAAPVLVVTRKAPDNTRLRAALEAAGCGERFAIAARSPEAERTRAPSGPRPWPCSRRRVPRRSSPRRSASRTSSPPRSCAASPTAASELGARPRNSARP